MRDNHIRLSSANLGLSVDAASKTPGLPVTSQGRDIEALLEEARSSVDPLVAVGLYQEALQSKPDDTRIMGDAAELMLQLGETAAAQEVRFVMTMETSTAFWKFRTLAMFPSRHLTVAFPSHEMTSSHRERKARPSKNVSLRLMKCIRRHPGAPEPSVPCSY